MVPGDLVANDLRERERENMELTTNEEDLMVDNDEDVAGEAELEENLIPINCCLNLMCVCLRVEQGFSHLFIAHMYIYACRAGWW